MLQSKKRELKSRKSSSKSRHVA